MLKGEDCGRHKHSNLLAVCNSLERCSYSHLGLSESNIAADKSVHRTIVLHIPLDCAYSLLLVRCILVHERRFKLLLHVRVG